MTKSKLWLPSDQIDLLENKLSETEAELAREKSESSKKDEVIAQTESALAQKTADYDALEKKYARLLKNLL